jgi:excinuclease UvrABC nuclease subunit
MSGPHLLNAQTIIRIVPVLSIGAYILSKEGRTVHYVGRSDNDLAARLTSHINDSQIYTHFWYEVSTSAKSAFELECNWWHKYKPSDNKNHPGRPNGSGWQCPICNIFQQAGWW